MSFCGKCGREVPEGALFCMKCGTPVPEKQSESKAVPVIDTNEVQNNGIKDDPTVVQNTETEVRSQEVTKTGSTDASPDLNSTSSSDRKRPRGVIPIIISAIICLLLILVIFIYQNNSNKDDFTGSGDSLTRMIDQANDNLEYIEQ